MGPAPRTEAAREETAKLGYLGEERRSLRTFRFYGLPALSHAPTLYGPHPARFISLLAPRPDVRYTKLAKHVSAEAEPEFAQLDAQIEERNRVQFVPEKPAQVGQETPQPERKFIDRDTRQTLQNLALMPGSQLRLVRPVLPKTFGEIQRKLYGGYFPMYKIPPYLHQPSEEDQYGYSPMHNVPIYHFPFTPAVQPFHSKGGPEQPTGVRRYDIEELDRYGVRPVLRPDMVHTYIPRVEEPRLRDVAAQREARTAGKRSGGCSTCP
jgi:hypothetical protein